MTEAPLCCVLSMVTALQWSTMNSMVRDTQDVSRLHHGPPGLESALLSPQLIAGVNDLYTLGPNVSKGGHCFGEPNHGTVQTRVRELLESDLIRRVHCKRSSGMHVYSQWKGKVMAGEHEGGNNCLVWRMWYPGSIKRTIHLQRFTGDSTGLATLVANLLYWRGHMRRI